MIGMSKRLRDSLMFSYVIVTGFATFFTVLGISLKDLISFDCLQLAVLNVVIRIVFLLFMYAVMSFFIWFIIGCKYKNSINLKIGSNDVIIKPGDIFEQDAWRVIAFDTHFSTVVDDVEISKTSLHGQLVLEHGEINGIVEAVKKEAERRKIQPNTDGRYTFPLGTAIHYEGKDGHYIMIALTNLDADYKASTRMSEYESTLMKMWSEISRVYAKHDLAFPILGGGITRFDDGQDDSLNLLRCMLCTLNTSKVHFKSNVSVIVYESKSKDGKKSSDLPLYEYKDLFRIVR